MHLGVFHPQRVKTLTTIDCVSFDSWPSPRTREQMAAGLESLIAASDAEHRRHFSDWILSATHDPDRLQSESLAEYLEMISGSVGQASLFQHQIRHYDPGHTSILTPHLAELGKLPVQIIWGADDAWQVVDWAHRLNTAIPGSSLKILEACGHIAPEDQPQSISELVLEHIYTY